MLLDMIEVSFQLQISTTTYCSIFLIERQE